MKVIFKILIVSLMFVSLLTHAVLDIKITQGIEQALPIAVVPFSWSKSNANVPVEVTKIITDNLKRSGRFDVMDGRDLPQQPTEFGAINFNDWRKLGMENILIGKLTLTANGHYDVSFRLIDIYRGKQIAGFRIPTKPNLLRRVAHQISDIVFKKLTGTAGAFDTRVAYITVKKIKDKKIHTLQIADADGYNQEVLLKSSEPLLSPAWSPNGKEIAYVSFENGSAEIFTQSMGSGKRTSVANFRGINSAPSWSPDGKKLAMTLSKGGNAEIYVMDIATKVLTRVTHSSQAIDTEAVWMAPRFYLLQEGLELLSYMK